MGVEKFVPSLESLSSLGLEGGILPGCPRPLGAFEKFVQKVCAHFSAPKMDAIPPLR